MGPGAQEGNSHESISGTAHHQRAVHTEVNATDWVTMRRQRPHEPSSADVPKKYSLIIAPTCKNIALWRELETVQIIVMSQQRFPATAASHASISPATNSPGRRAYPSLGWQILICAGRMRWFTCRAVPETDGFVVASGGDRFGVGRPRQAGDASHVTHEGVHMCASFGIPNHGGSICRGRGNPSAIGRDARLGDGFVVAAQLKGGLEVGTEGLVGLAVA